MEQQKLEQGKKEYSLLKKSFTDLKGWQKEDFTKAVLTFRKSCVKIMQQQDKDLKAVDVRFSLSDLQRVCNQAYLLPKDNDLSKRFFEDNFLPFQIAADDNSRALFTGYHEIALKGSKQKSAKFNYPLYAVPDDMVTVKLADFSPNFGSKKVIGRVVDKQLMPYPTHQEIDEKPIPAKVLAWVDDPVQAIFLHIQGSGIIELENSNKLKLNYAGQNGHEYHSMGKELIKRGLMKKEQVNAESIKTWLKQNPVLAKEIIYSNPSYVFFKEIEGEGPIGAQGVPLTANRSLAVDNACIPLGLPLWLSTKTNQSDDLPPEDINRIMMAQDTGGAIKTPMRGDIFFGSDKKAEKLAGYMNSTGELYILLPNHQSSDAKQNEETDK